MGTQEVYGHKRMKVNITDRHRDRDRVKVLRLRLGQSAKRDGIDMNEESGRRRQKFRARENCAGGETEEGSLRPS